MPDLPEEGNIHIKQDLVKIRVTGLRDLDQGHKGTRLHIKLKGMKGRIRCTSKFFAIANIFDTWDETKGKITFL